MLSTVKPSKTEVVSSSLMLIFLSSEQNPLQAESDLLPSVPLCVLLCPPNASCLLVCVGVALSDVCACMEVVLRA